MNEFERIYQDGQPTEKIHNFERKYGTSPVRQAFFVVTDENGVPLDPEIHSDLILRTMLQSMPSQTTDPEIKSEKPTEIDASTVSSKRAIKKSVRRQHKV